MNLVINARDAINENKDTAGERRIIIETKSIYLDSAYTSNHPGSRIGPHVLIIISDTGTGMDQKTRGKIFDPFFTTKEMGRGTGLGLTTVFGIVKQNDGSIYVYSEPGKGTRFKIYWPVTDSTEYLVHSDEIDTIDISGEEQILLVEDDPKVRSFAKTALQSFGYTVQEAETGVEAMKLLNSGASEMDLIISDVVMPEMGGRELALKIRETFPELHILLTSGYSDTHTLKREVTDPKIHFIHKPYSIQDLALKVRQLLDLEAGS
jgi:CheY-like chemotaxis protein